MLSFRGEDKIKAEDQNKVDFSHNISGDNFVRSGALFECIGKIKERMMVGIKRIDKRKFWLRFFGLILVMAVMGLIGTVTLFVWYARDLPSPSRVVRREGYASRIYDRNGELLYDVFREAKRMPVTWEEVPDYLKMATIAIEDKDFYKHKGFDPLTPLRILKNLVFRGRLIGGSTLTQQLVKNVLLTSERTITRKIKEFILAVQIEAKYDKNEILLMYLNEAPYGGAAWGVGSGSEMIFGKHVSELNLAESVILAGLPQKPSAYSPLGGNGYVGRSKEVLRRMVEDGMISSDLADETFEEIKNYQFRANENTLAAPHFIFWVKQRLAERYGEEVVEGGGLKITTTLDRQLQEKVEEVVAEEVEKAENKGISNGAAVVVDPRDGQVLAMVGSRGYFSDKTDGKFNVATQGLRQPGSAIKPVTYLTAIKEGWTAASMIMDVETHFTPGQGGKDYVPQNYNGKFNGPISVREALGNSINVPAVKMLARVGLEDMLYQAYEMGLVTLEPTAENMRRFGLAVTLGGAEVKLVDLAAAYSSFANYGHKIDLVGVLKVEDRSGRVLEEFKYVEGKRVMSAQEAFILNSILSDNNARLLTFGPASGLNIDGYQVAVKTGTTNDKRDNWCIGWTPNVLATAWVGNNDNSPMKKVASGVSGATPIWRRIMLFELPRREKEDFYIPSGVVSMEVDKISGWPVHDGFPGRTEYFIEGTQPRGDDPIHMKLKVCKDKDGLAPPEDVAAGNYEEKEFIKLQEEDPVSTDGRNRWQEGIEAWIAVQDDPGKYRPPDDYCREGGRLLVRFESPEDKATVSNQVEIKVGTESLRKVVEVKLWVNGEEKQVWTERPFETYLELEDGKYELKVEAVDRDGNRAGAEVKIGVNMPWDWQPSPTPTITPTATPTIEVLSPTPTEELIPSPSPTVSLTPTPTL